MTARKPRRARRPKLRLVWVAPPAERLVEVAIERQEHVKAWRSVERRARDKKAAAERHLNRTCELTARVRAAAIHDLDDVEAALTIAFYEFIDSAPANFGGDDAALARAMVAKVLDWLTGRAPEGPDGPPQLVG